MLCTVCFTKNFLQRAQISPKLAGCYSRGSLPAAINNVDQLIEHRSDAFVEYSGSNALLDKVIARIEKNMGLPAKHSQSTQYVCDRSLEAVQTGVHRLLTYSQGGRYSLHNGKLISTREQVTRCATHSTDAR